MKNGTSRKAVSDESKKSNQDTRRKLNVLQSKATFSAGKQLGFKSRAF